MSLLAPEIWTNKLFTGAWVEGQRRQDAIEPATGEVLGTFAMADVEQLGRSTAAAAEAQPAWADRPYNGRAAVLRRAALVLAEHRDEVRTWVQREAGKVRQAAELEMDLALEELWEAASLASRPRGEVLQTSRPGRVSIGRRVPWGVVAVIAPWNFPLNLAMRSVAPALACGNAVVLKPATETVVCSGVVIARIFEEAGLPAGVLHMLPGKGSELGTAFPDDPHVGMLSFTGSTPVGKQLSEAAGRNIVKMVAELGGKNPFVVLDDADVKKAAAAGAYASFTHQGQICMATGRHLVAESLADDYAEELRRIADAMTVGNPLDDVDLGPIINQSQVDHIEDIVRRTLDAGARRTAGAPAEGLFLRPIVLEGVTPDMPAHQEEIFGPVAPIVTFADDDEAVRLANATPYGLVAAVQSRSEPRARRVGLRIKAGMVHVNDQTVNDEVVAPFGGWGDSGAGAFGTLTNVDEFTTWQWLTVHDDQAVP